MEPMSSATERAFLESLRVRRAELRASMSALEHALAAPYVGVEVPWSQRVRSAVDELSADLREHIDLTEGPDGLYRELLSSAPRLSEAVSRLRHEHELIKREVDDLLARLAEPESGEDVDGIRDQGTRLLGTLMRHRQRGSDLVYQAYEVDIGGET